MSQDPDLNYGGGTQNPFAKGWEDYWPPSSATTTRFIPCINWWDEHEFDFLKPKKKKPRHKKKKKRNPFEPYEPSEKQPYPPYQPKQPSPWDPTPWRRKERDPPYPTPWPQWRDENTEK